MINARVQCPIIDNLLSACVKDKTTPSSETKEQQRQPTSTSSSDIESPPPYTAPHHMLTPYDQVPPMTITAEEVFGKETVICETPLQISETAPEPMVDEAPSTTPFVMLDLTQEGSETESSEGNSDEAAMKRYYEELLDTNSAEDTQELPPRVKHPRKNPVPSRFKDKFASQDSTAKRIPEVLSEIPELPSTTSPFTVAAIAGTAEFRAPCKWEELTESWSWLDNPHLAALTIPNQQMLMKWSQRHFKLLEEQRAFQQTFNSVQKFNDAHQQVRNVLGKNLQRISRQITEHGLRLKRVATTSKPPVAAAIEAFIGAVSSRKTFYTPKNDF